ncbi:MAG: hypothetical protein GXP18_01425 [Gammaproteobacteria bacterium]|nr:hypothetical protein [Gammaproteobacteria bacterium]
MMMGKVVKSCAIILFIVSLPGIVHSFDEESSSLQWDTVRGSSEESGFLMNLFIGERMHGEYPILVKQRFREIAQLNDAVFLLDKLFDPDQRDQHTHVYTLLKEIQGDDFVLLLESRFFSAANQGLRNKLLNLITNQNSVAAFGSATRIIERLQAEGLYDEAMGYLGYMVRFDHFDIRQEAINGSQSSSNIIRSASYVTLRNYPDEEVESIIDDALAAETATVAGEERRLTRSRSYDDTNSPLINILITTKKMLGLNKQRNNNQRMRRRDGRLRSTIQTQSVSSGSSDTVLAETYAPQLRLSDPGAIGVNIRDSSYLYTDYIPVDVNDVTSNPNRPINLNLSDFVIYNGMPYGPGSMPLSDGEVDIIGDIALRSSSNYLDFSPIWAGITTTVSSGYKSLSLNPTVYFRVFRDSGEQNPIAVQYWFFYFYNDWLNDHPGDWESITVFLNDSAQPVEVAYSTHSEARRYSWSNVEVVNSTHPNVYVSNGGHGSYYESGNTLYTIAYDNHMGDKEVLSFGGSGYSLVNLGNLEQTNNSWVWFEGRWGDQYTAPRGPLLRTDTPNFIVWGSALYPPYNPYENCSIRYAANIYGDNQNVGPWFWASGYGLDTPWENAADCEPISPPLVNCVASISLEQSVSGSWEPGCVSTNRAGRYAKYYTFTLSNSQEVTIDLQSSTDTYLYLLNGSDENGSVVASDDDGGNGLNSRIVRILSAGTYTIEATTYGSGATGSFTVSVAGNNAPPPPPPLEDCANLINLNQFVSGNWETGCASTRRAGSYAKYYTFTLSSSQVVIIDLQSSIDTYLYLLNGAGENGSVVASDDDGGSGFNSRIVRTLSAGTYTVEATTYSSGMTGSFSVSIQ